MKRLSSASGQFLGYLASGGFAFVLDFGSFLTLTRMGAWYMIANTVGNVLGFLATFLFNKYLVFGKRAEMMNHFVRFCLLNVLNIIVQSILLYLFVERLSMDHDSAKFASWALTIAWNFFFYKFLVYV